MLLRRRDRGRAGRVHFAIGNLAQSLPEPPQDLGEIHQRGRGDIARDFQAQDGPAAGARRDDGEGKADLNALEPQRKPGRGPGACHRILLVREPQRRFGLPAQPRREPIGGMDRRDLGRIREHGRRQMPEQIFFGEAREWGAEERRSPVGPHADGAQGDGIAVPGLAHRLLHAVLDARASPRIRQRDGEPVHQEDAIRAEARGKARPLAVSGDGGVERQG